MGGRRGIKLSPAGLLHFLGEREAKLIADGEENDVHKD